MNTSDAKEDLRRVGTRHSMNTHRMRRSVEMAIGRQGVARSGEDDIHYAVTRSLKNMTSQSTHNPFSTRLNEGISNCQTVRIVSAKQGTYLMIAKQEKCDQEV